MIVDTRIVYLFIIHFVFENVNFSFCASSGFTLVQSIAVDNFYTFCSHGGEKSLCVR